MRKPIEIDERFGSEERVYGTVLLSEVRELEKALSIAVEALQRISENTWSGNRSALEAYEALRRIEEQEK